MTKSSVSAFDRRRLIVFTRCPDAGCCKTRLIPVLGIEGATALHAALVRHTMGWASTAMDGIAEVEVHYSGDDLDGLKGLSGEGCSIPYERQSEGDLGARLAAAFESAFQSGCSKVAIVGTDCPELNVSHVKEAFDELDHADVAIGPAVDGGYYLIALRKPGPQLFEDVAWGEASVLETTLQKAKSLRLDVRLLSELADIDGPDDLKGWPAPGFAWELLDK